MKAIKLCLLISVMCSLSLTAQDRRIGLTGSIQGGQFGIGMPVWTGAKFMLVPAIELKIAQGMSSDLGIGLAARKYLKVEKIAPYLGVKAGALINIPSKNNEFDDSTLVDKLLGLNAGAEYFIDEKFSFGVEAQGNFTLSDSKSQRFGNPGKINFNTGTAITATVYF